MSKQAVIVDDEPEFCYLMSGICLRKGVRPKCIHTLKEALTVNLFEPDFLFLDNTLPDGNGLTHLSKLRKHLNPRKVILVSGEDLFASPNDYGDMGFDLFLSKPVRIVDVIRILSMRVQPV